MRVRTEDAVRAPGPPLLLAGLSGLVLGSLSSRCYLRAAHGCSSLRRKQGFHWEPKGLGHGWCCVLDPKGPNASALGRGLIGHRSCFAAGLQLAEGWSLGLDLDVMSPCLLPLLSPGCWAQSNPPLPVPTTPSRPETCIPIDLSSLKPGCPASCLHRRKVGGSCTLLFLPGKSPWGVCV